MSEAVLYKWLNGREATHVAGYRYRLGRWTQPIQGDLIPCHNGYHLMRVEHLSRWIARDLFVAVCDGDQVDHDGNKIVVRRCRIVEHLKLWTPRTSALTACDFAEHVLPLWEKRFPDDERPRLAIQAGRDCANGLISRQEAAGAARAAWAAGAARAAEAAERQWQGERILDYAHGRLP